MEPKREYAWPRKAKAKPAPKPAAKKKPARKAKPVGYLVTLQGGAQVHVDGRAKGFEAGLLREGVVHEGAWYPPHAVFRVERRDA